ncbi:MAG: guanylate kinase [Pseudomonadota bacterium]
MIKGTLFIISAPSGAGKTSLVKRLRAELDHIAVSVSHTTRDKRPGEIHGHDYFFVNATEFQAMLDNGAFLEHAKVFDSYYGTSKATVEDALAGGEDVILEIDWQGAQQVREMAPRCISIFILPPSRAILEERLRGRGQDSEETISRRMRDAINEMSHYNEFDYLIVNDDFECALFQLKGIIVTYRLEKSRQAEDQAPLIAALLDPS